MDAQRVLRELEQQGATLATAESLTGGRLAAAVTAVPGASRVYVGGVVAYASRVKRELLGVDAGLVTRHGVVSAECARAMAEGVRRLLGAAWGVSTTGVAGPGRQEGKPVGTVYVAVAGPRGTSITALELVGARAAIQARACEEALASLGTALRGEEPGLR